MDGHQAVATGADVLGGSSLDGLSVAVPTGNTPFESRAVLLQGYWKR